MIFDYNERKLTVTVFHDETLNNEMFQNQCNIHNKDLVEIKFCSETGRKFKVDDCAYLFYDLPHVKKITGLSYFDTSDITDMNNMFDGCKSLIALDLRGFDTSKVTDMGSMFLNCKSLASLNLSSFDTSNVTDMSFMFSFCCNLKTINLKHFNTSNVTDMGYMFDMCKSLESLDLRSFNTDKVIDMTGMFEYCESLTSLDLSNFDTSNVINMSYMFYGCFLIISLDLSNFYINSETDVNDMFTQCNLLKSINLTVENKISLNRMFDCCKNEKQLKQMILLKNNPQNITVQKYPLTFRLYATIKMNRAVDKENDYISPGGYEFVMNGKNVQFDFEESQTMIDKEDPSIIHIMQRDPDYDCFKELLSLTKEDLKNVTEIPEFFVFTGKMGETDLAPVSLLDCSFVLPYGDFRKIDIPKDACKKAVLASNITLQEDIELE